MAQILITIEDTSMADRLMRIIEKMKGVSRATFYPERNSEVSIAKKVYSPRIMRLRGVAKNVLQEAENDDRLNYLLSK